MVREIYMDIYIYIYIYVVHDSPAGGVAAGERFTPPHDRNVHVRGGRKNQC